MTIENIADLNLHDSEWIETLIRPTDEGDKNIVVELDYITNYESFETERKALTFVRCWGARFQMNFRVAGPDSIYSAEEMADSDFISEIQSKWKAVNLFPASELRHFVITAGTTGSKLEVVAEELILSNSN